MKKHPELLNSDLRNVSLETKVYGAGDKSPLSTLGPSKMRSREAPPTAFATADALVTEPTKEVQSSMMHKPYLANSHNEISRMRGSREQ